MSSSPATIRKVVVFPHPEGPTNTTNSLSSISRFTLFTATTSSENFFTRLRKVTCAIDGPSSWHLSRRHWGCTSHTPILLRRRLCHTCGVVSRHTLPSDTHSPWSALPPAGHMHRVPHGGEVQGQAPTLGKVSSSALPTLIWIRLSSPSAEGGSLPGRNI